MHFRDGHYLYSLNRISAAPTQESGFHNEAVIAADVEAAHVLRAGMKEIAEPIRDQLAARKGDTPRDMVMMSGNDGNA